MFSWGEHGCQLGDGSNISTADGVPFLNRVHITELSAGRTVLAFIQGGGEASVIRTEESEDGRRVRGEQKFVKFKDKIKAVSCGDDTVTLLSERGQVLCLDTSLVPRPLAALCNIEVSQVACGSQHSVALSKDGQVYTWGQGSGGQLGLGERQLSATSPQHLNSLSAVPLVQISGPLGVILYMLVCGVPPFQETNDSETLVMILDCR
ncbi:hypothetical protein KUCAC02_021411 [Chaenocephalus aceratus]|uniref:Uncharacterized protein n=1 Tax=Chaenocephalus aceratus TaxID=36190 RepID=A0ACB9XGN6_CHAAC|nr:hypothetical protein KUCAC02_021411 [Chaenocephalus aceratus]